MEDDLSSKSLFNHYTGGGGGASKILPLEILSLYMVAIAKSSKEMLTRQRLLMKLRMQRHTSKATNEFSSAIIPQRDTNTSE